MIYLKRHYLLCLIKLSVLFIFDIEKMCTAINIYNTIDVKICLFHQSRNEIVIALRWKVWKSYQNNLITLSSFTNVTTIFIKIYVKWDIKETNNEWRKIKACFPYNNLITLLYITDVYYIMDLFIYSFSKPGG